MMPAHIVTMSHTRIDTGVLLGYTHAAGVLLGYTHVAKPSIGHSINTGTHYAYVHICPKKKHKP